MRAYHFLLADMRSGYGDEPPWTVGETRRVTGKVVLCEYGYHWSPSWYDGVSYSPGPVACIVEVDDAEPVGDKGVSRWRRLVAAHDVSRELRLFACDCAERALSRELDAGCEPGPRLWEAIAVARRYVSGEATADDLREAARDAARNTSWEAARDASWEAARNAARNAACDAARDASWEAARNAACDAAWNAARNAACDAAWNAAWEAEVAWQRKRLAELLDPLFAEVEA